MRITPWLALVLVGCGAEAEPPPRPARPPAKAPAAPPPPVQEGPRDELEAALNRLKDADPRVRLQASQALRRMADEDDANPPRLLEALKRPDPQARAGLLKALAEVCPATPEALDAIRPLLKDGVEEIRVCAIPPLARIVRSYEEATPLLVEALQDRSPKVRAAVVQEIHGLGPLSEKEAPRWKEAAPILARSLKDKDDTTRRGAAAALQALGPAAIEVVPDLVEALHDPDREVRRWAQEALGQMGAGMATALKPAFEKSHPTIRLVLLRSLKSPRGYGPGAVDLALQGLRDGDPEVRKEAQSVLRDATLAMLRRWEEGDDAPENERRRTGSRGEPPPSIRKDLEVLTAAMRDKNVSVREGALYMVSLFRPAPAEMESAVLEAVRDKDPRVRSAAMNELGRLNLPGEKVGLALAPGLQEDDPSVRQVALQSLIQMGSYHKDAIPIWLEALKSRFSDVRKLAAQTVGSASLPSQHLPALLESADSTDLEVRRGVLEAVERTAFNERRGGPGAPGLKGAVPRVLPSLNNENAEVRLAAIRALGAVGNAASEAVPALVGIMKDKDPKVRCAGAHALGRIGPGSAELVIALAGALKDPDVEVRGHAIGGLRMLGAGAREAAPALGQALKDSELNVRLGAIMVLKEMGPEAQPARAAIVEATRDQDSNVRSHAVSVLANLGTENAEAVAPLVKALDDSNAGVRIGAIRNLAGMARKDRSAAAALAAALSHSDKSVRQAASEGLGSALLTREDLPALRRAFEGKDPTAQMAALRWIERFIQDAKDFALPLAEALRSGAPGVQDQALRCFYSLGAAAGEAVPMLIEALKYRDLRARRHAARALGLIGSPKAVVPLIEALKDDNSEVRYSALTALGAMGPAAQEAVPALNELLKSDPSQGDEIRRVLDRIQKQK